MAKGRMRQMRQHAVNQAAMVWGMFGDMKAEQLGKFVETGKIDAEAAVERIPFNPAMLEDLQKRAQ